MSKKSRYINPTRVHLARKMRRFAKGTKPGMLVLDAGAGRSPYRRLFAHATYEAADFAKLGTDYAPLDYVCDLRDIPVESSRFDRIIFNQVLEHLDDPVAVLAELYRVLKPGGQILCSCPLFYEEHQKPYDFYRYTQFALRKLFGGAGFEVVRLEWLEGYFGTVSHQFQQMYRYLPRDVRKLRPGWRIIYIAPLLVILRQQAKVLRRVFASADLRWKYTASGHPKNYVVIARKPHASSAVEHQR